MVSLFYSGLGESISVHGLELAQIHVLRAILLLDNSLFGIVLSSESERFQPMRKYCFTSNS